MKTIKKLAMLMPLLILDACASPRSPGGYPAAWDTVTQGMTRQQVVHTLGQWHHQSEGNVDVWRKRPYWITVTFNESQQATNIVIQTLAYE